MLTIRPFQASDAEYDAFVAIHNANWPDNPRTVDEEKHADANRDTAHFLRRLIGELSGKIIGTGECGETFWLGEPEQYYWHYNFLPDYANQGYEEQMHDALMAQLAPLNPRKFYVGMRDDKRQQIEFIEQRDYRLIQVEQTSSLDVTTFDSTRFSDMVTRVQQQGIRFFTLRVLRQTDPDCLPKLWSLRWEIRQDVPWSGQITREPLEELEKRVNNPNVYDQDAFFVAVHQTDGVRMGEYIGMTRLTYNKVDPTIGRTHLTGVLRSYRRQGIATALKVHAISEAQAQGVRRIDTMNNEVNPMLDLNIRLGFKTGPAWRYYEKTL